uniref:Uncharacterized protein n=1 Tax=Arundo donax TaxID=35708 RepID=A0A0A9FLA4_ARUDO
MKTSYKHYIQWHSISMHASSCSVHMSFRKQYLNPRCRCASRCPRRLQRDMGHPCDACMRNLHAYLSHQLLLCTFTAALRLVQSLASLT